MKVVYVSYYKVYCSVSYNTQAGSFLGSVKDGGAALDGTEKEKLITLNPIPQTPNPKP